MTVTTEQFRQAMVVVENYCNTIEVVNSKDVRQTGCPVKLSKWGLEMQGKGKAKLRGKIIHFYMFVYPTQGTVTVKWETIKKPDSMDISQVEPI